MNPDAKILFDYLRSVIYDPGNAVLELPRLSDDFQDLGKGMQYFSQCVLETTALARALARGDLNHHTLPRPENEIAAPIKALHASLRHLTWQTQQVAQGDYQQRVNFMGDFSEAFNTMTTQLEQQRAALLEEIENKHQQMQALAQNNSLLELIARQISQWIIVMNTKSNEWLFFNRSSDQVLTTPDDEEQFLLWLNAQVEVMQHKDRSFTTELELANSLGRQSFSVTIHPLNWHGQEALAFVLTDISAEKEHLRSLNEFAYRDSLTQIANRRYGMQVLQDWLSNKQTFCLCFVDIDNVKYVNDWFGHAEGDRYILYIVNILRTFSSEAVLCRIGGDEFMLLIQNMDKDEAEMRLASLQHEMTDQYVSIDIFYSRRISYGVIEVTSDNLLTASELLSIADDNMYEYKRAHKFRYPGNAQ